MARSILAWSEYYVRKEPSMALPIVGMRGFKNGGLIYHNGKSVKACAAENPW